MRRSATLVLALTLLAGACGNEGPREVLQATPGPPGESEVSRIEAAVGASTDLEFLGTVTRGDATATLVTFTNQQGEACAAVFVGNGYSSGCGDLEARVDSVIIIQTGFRSTTGLVVATSPEITEIRITTGSGDTYAVARLGSLSYITFDNDRSGYRLSLVAGDEVVHTE